MPYSKNPGHRRRRTGSHHPPSYLITLPVHNQQVRVCMDTVTGLFNLGEREWHEPHITLCGPFTLSPGCDPVTLLRDYLLLTELPPSFQAYLGAFSLLRGKKGFAVVTRVEPDEALTRFASEIREILAPHLWTCTWIDRVPGRRIFHISIGFGLRHTRAQSILQSLGTLPDGTQKPLEICRLAETTSCSLRLAVIRRGFLWRAFDLPRGIWLTRGEIFREGEERKTLAEYRRRNGYQLDEPHYEEHDALFVISDLHLGHSNIITYTSRPFTDVETMDRVLIRNWNWRVKSTDTVYFLGDLRHGKDAKPAQYYLPLLAGLLHFVAGNHDYRIEGSEKSLELPCRGLRFLMVHDPLDAPQGYEGYVIHGHVHNNQCREFPFLNMPGRRVNVSAEMIGYVPLCLDELADLIEAAPAGAKFTTLADARRILQVWRG